MKSMTAHAVRRASQRNLTQGDIRYVLQNGSKIHKAGACFYYLCQKDILPEDRQEDEITRLEGTAVVLDPEQHTILTVYRNRERGLREIKKKQDYLVVGV
jgi:hypothetical protein